MTWLKTDDGEWCHPWVSIAGPTAYGVYQRLMGYCAQHETDGLVPPEFATLILSSAGDQADAIRETLLAQGRITEHTLGRRKTGGLVLPYYLEHNPTRAALDAEQKSRSSKARKAAEARWGKSEPDGSEDGGVKF